MSFDKNDPRLTAYVLDEIDDASERAAMDGALEADPELRVLIDELTNASHVLEQALDGSSEADNLLDPDQRANVEARASMALSRRARMRRRLVYGGLAAAAPLAVISALVVPGVLERAKLDHTRLSGLNDLLQTQGSLASRVPSTNAPVAAPSDPLIEKEASPVSIPDDAIGGLEEFQVNTSGISASKRRDGLTSDTQELASKIPSVESMSPKGQTVPASGERLYDLYYDTGATPLGTYGGGGFGGQGASGGAGGFGGGSTSVGGGGGFGGKSESGWAYNGTGTQTLGAEQSSQLQSLGYLGDRSEAESRNLGRTITGFAVTDLDGDGINESIRLYAREPEIVSLYAWQYNSSQSESYAPTVENAFVQVSQQPLSTFGLDVDTASYANVRRFLNNGQLPPPDAVRVEEFVNAFQYEYAAPGWDGHSVAVHGEIAGCPWNPEHRLVRIAVKAKEIPFESQPPLRLTFLIDVSGSMEDNNKLPLLRESMKALTRKLRPSDQIAIVTYRDTAQRVMGPTPCSNADGICATIDSLRADGSTNGAGGIELAYAAAKEQFNQEGLNRVILATDGDFNVGETENAALVQRIQEHAKSGVFLTVLGFGVDNLKDDRLEGLANKGNGNYYYIDSFAEANKVLVDRMAGTIAVAAKDAKIQVEFNPAKVGAYRLLGYENRALAAQDFNDDRKDAGDLGAGHTVTALYELVPVGVSIGAPGVDNLKYQPTPAPPSNDNPETMTVKLRYKEPNASESKRIDLPLIDKGMRFEDEPADFRFAVATAAFAMLLRNSQYAGNATLETVQQVAEQSANGAPDRTEFVSLVVAAKTLRGGG